MGLSERSCEKARVMRICGERRCGGGVRALGVAAARMLRGARRTRCINRQAALALGRRRGGDAVRLGAGEMGSGGMSVSWIVGCSSPGT